MSEIFQFTVNGKLRTTDKDKPLLRYLRDDLHLHSVKDGCSEGACGTCTVIVDGKATKACILTTRKAVGKTIQTVEGLTDFEKEAFVYAFGSSYQAHKGNLLASAFLDQLDCSRRTPSSCEHRVKHEYIPLLNVEG